MGALLTLLLITVFISSGATSHNPHQPANLTWVIYNPETGQVLNLSSNVACKGTWLPVLIFHLCVLAADSNGFDHHQLTKFFATALSVCSPITVSEKAHSSMNRCLSMSAQGEEKIRTKLKNVGQLTLFTKISPESKRETSPAEERTKSPTRLV